MSAHEVQALAIAITEECNEYGVSPGTMLLACVHVACATALTVDALQAESLMAAIVADWFATMRKGKES